MTSGRRRGIKLLASVAACALAGIGVVGFLHTPAGRPWLGRLGVACPARNVTPAAAEALRRRGVDAARGSTPAPARPALGLQLDRSSEADVRAWAAARGVTCRLVTVGLRQLQCPNVPAAALAGISAAWPIDEVMFALDPSDRLVSVDVLRSRLPAEAAARLFTQQIATLTGALGAAPTQFGEPTATYLSSGQLRTALATYRYADYLASVTAMNLATGVALREQYQSAGSRVQ